MLEQSLGDIVQWQETTNTFIEVQLDIDKWTTKEATVRFSIRAISYCGLFQTAHTDLFVTV